MNGLVRLSLASLGVGILFLLAGIASLGALNWLQAHGVVLIVGCLLPAIAAFHGHALRRFGPTDASKHADWQARSFAAATLFLAFGVLLQPSGVFTIVAILGWLALLAASVFSLLRFLAAKPTESLVDVERDPLTKGDDASFKHLKMSHFFFPVGVLLTSLAFMPGLSGPDWAPRFWYSGIHVMLVGYLLLSLYGLGHLWVPRFSGVPAIAAGAIKGELHSTLPALIFLPVGFLTGLGGFVIAGGAFAFLGFFTYMGVLGANIMRNKSVTHRVTPEFVYIPWTFSGIFWLISGVLMGIFLTVVPDILSDRAASLATVHVHISLLGGTIQLLMGWLTRMIPGDNPPPQFAGAMKLAFYGFNVATTIAVFNMLGAGDALWYAAAAALLLVSMLAYGKAMGEFIMGSPSGRS